jgi:hypothetical protein
VDDLGITEAVQLVVRRLMATLDEFAAMTKRIIASDGFDDYFPTAVYPGRRHVVVLEGAPEGPELESIAVDWAAKGAAEGEEFLVAFKVGPEQFKVVRRFAGVQEEKVYDVADDA